MQATTADVLFCSVIHVTCTTAVYDGYLYQTEVAPVHVYEGSRELDGSQRVQHLPLLDSHNSHVHRTAAEADHLNLFQAIVARCKLPFIRSLIFHYFMFTRNN